MEIIIIRDDYNLLYYNLYIIEIFFGCRPTQRFVFCFYLGLVDSHWGLTIPYNARSLVSSSDHDSDTDHSLYRWISARISPWELAFHILRVCSKGMLSSRLCCDTRAATGKAKAGMAHSDCI